MIHFLLSLIIIFGPLARGAVMPWQFLIIYMLAAIAMFIGIFRIFYANAREIVIRRTPLDLPLLLILSIYAIGMFHSKYIYGSIAEFSRILILVVIFYTVVNFIREEQDIKRLLNIALISCGVISLFGILQYMGALNKSWWDNPAFLSASYVNHNHFAGYIELVIPLSIGMALLEKGMAKKVFYLYIFLILAAAFMLSMSRGGWLSLSISMIFMATIIFRKGKARFVVLIMALFFIMLIVFVLKAVDIGILMRRISSYRELDFSGRIEIWKGTLGIIKDNPFLGTGPGTFIFSFPRYRPAGLNMLVNYSHNDYLQVASEAGVLGLAIFIFIILRIITKGIKTHMIARSSFKSWVSLSLATGILSMAIHGMGDFNFYIPANAVLFVIFSAILFNINSIKEKGAKVIVARPSLIVHRASMILTALALFSLLIVICACLTAEFYYIGYEKALLRKGYRNAESALRGSIRFWPFNYLYHYKLARVYDEVSGKDSDSVGYLEKSVAEYKRALRFNNIDSWVWLGLADVYYRLYQILALEAKFKDLAYSSYSTALKLDPMNSYYMKRFGAFLLNSGDTDMSGAIYKKAKDAMSRSATLSRFSAGLTDADRYLRSADLAFRSQDINKALAFYSMAKGFGNKRAALGQVRCYMKMSNMKKAIEIYRLMEKSNENKAVIFAAIGDYCLSRGLGESAKRFSSMAIKIDPSNPEGYQLRYKLIKRGYANFDSYVKIWTKPTMSLLSNNILGFNKGHLSGFNITPDSFELVFDIDKGLYKDGNLYKEMVLPAGIYEIGINAKGKEGMGVWPHIIARFNGAEIMDAYIEKDDFNVYRGIAIVDYPVNELEIAFDNDYYDPETNQDRNVYIKAVTLKAL